MLQRSVRQRRRAVRWVAAAVVTCLVVAGWLAATTGGEPAALPHFVATQEYLPGVEADVYLPAATTEPTAVVVLLPGGGWSTADRGGLAPLADRLAGDGLVAVNATYRTEDDGVHYPVPVRDIRCAVRFAADRARREGFGAGPVVVVGHSSGAHLAALAALGDGRFDGACDYPQAPVSGLVGLAGPYSIRADAELVAPLFDDDVTSQQWLDASPFSWVAARAGTPPLPVLLLHGAADPLVDPEQSRSFAGALRRAGHPVRLTVVPGADHDDLYQVEVVAEPLERWLDGL